MAQQFMTDSRHNFAVQKKPTPHAAVMAFAAVGKIEILQANAAPILFVWGPTHVLPLPISDMTITEEAYDINLNPTNAKVDLTLEVLSYNDLAIATPGQELFMAHQIAKETLAAAASIGGLAALGI